jgi:thioredoxin-like negative regulator of GroEL
VDLEALLAQAKQAIKTRDKAGARKILDILVMEDPHNEQAWMLLAGVVSHKNEKLDCLAQVLAINPENQAAKELYDKLRQPVVKVSHEKLNPPAKPEIKKKRKK